MTDEKILNDDELTSTMPEADPDVIAQIGTGDNDANSVPETDSAGNVFDPSKHDVDANGKPKLTKTGRFRKKRKSSVIRSSKAEAREKEIESEHIRMSAAATVDGIATIARAIGGDDFQFEKLDDYDERRAGIDAFASYYKSKGITDVPAGVIVTTWIIGYVSRRLMMERTQSRLKKLFAFFKKKGK